MGLLDLFQKGKQVVTDVQDEIENWQSIDPEVLRAIADEDLALAKNLYVQKTGASRVRAALVVERIAETVQRYYPYDDPAYWGSIDPEVLRYLDQYKTPLAVLAYMRKTGSSEETAYRILSKIEESVQSGYHSFLKKEALASVSHSWPYEESVVVGFKPTPHDKNKISIAYIYMDVSIEKYVLKKYYLNIRYIDYCDKPYPHFRRILNQYDAIFKDNIIYLRNKDGDVMELVDFKIGDLNFNTQDSEYKRYKRLYGQLISENEFEEFETFDMDDLRKVEAGKMSMKALLSAATRYKFIFEQNWNHTAYYLKTENFDLRDILKKLYLDFYKTINEDCLVVPWQNNILNLVSNYNEESYEKLDSVIREHLRTKFPEYETLAEGCVVTAKDLIYNFNKDKFSFYLAFAEMRLNTQYMGEDKPIAVLALPFNIFDTRDDGRIAALHRFPIHKPFENLELSIQLFKDKSKKIVLSGNGLYREFSVISKKK